MTVKEYNEWRKEFGRVQVLLYAFPNVLKKIGNEDLIRELKILGYDEHTLDFLNSAMDALEKAEKEELMKDMNVQPDPDTIPVPKKILKAMQDILLTVFVLIAIVLLNISPFLFLQSLSIYVHHTYKMFLFLYSQMH